MNAQEYFLKWLSILHSITLALAHASAQSSKLQFDNVAERLEELARNIRDRTKNLS